MGIFGRVVGYIISRQLISHKLKMIIGTVTNGNDMIAAFLKQLYPGPLSKTVCSIADVGDRGQDFPPEAASGAEHASDDGNTS